MEEEPTTAVQEAAALTKAIPEGDPEVEGVPEVEGAQEVEGVPEAEGISKIKDIQEVEGNPEVRAKAGVTLSQRVTTKPCLLMLVVVAVTEWLAVIVQVAETNIQLAILEKTRASRKEEKKHK